jgi:pantothenate kinase
MIELQKFLDIMATDCELEVVEDSAFGVLVDGYNYEIDEISDEILLEDMDDDEE